jgi:hypothetical protein
MLSATNKSIMLSVVMLNVVMLNVIMLSVVMLNVIMLSVVAQQPVQANILESLSYTPKNFFRATFP